MKFKVLTIAALAFALSACSTTQVAQKQSAKTPVAAPKKIIYEFYVKAGDAFPLTEVTTIDNKIVSLSNSNEQKLVILFATWCTDSQRAMKALKNSQLLKQKNLEVVAIARENSVEQVEKFKKEYGLNIHFVADVDRSIYKQFANAGIPRFITVDKNNIVKNHVIAEGENQMALIRW